MKRVQALLNAMGKDRLGIADDLAAILETWNCSIESSKMAVLGDQFAAIILFSGPENQVAALIKEDSPWGQLQDLHIDIRPITGTRAKKEGLAYLLETVSLDAPGILHAVTRVLRNFQVNIEDLDTESASAPFTGSPMFIMKLRVTVPTGISPSEVREALFKAALNRDMDIKFTACSGIS